jgi:hypothetical protein
MKKLLLATTLLVAVSQPLMASEVYIDQVGGNLNVDVLQENGNNRINTESEAMTIDGDDITVNLTQSGDANEADLEFESGASTTTFSYTATGDMNIITGKIFGGINNTFTTDIVGSDNVMTYCQTYTNSVCNGIIVDNTDTATNIIGNNNTINYALDSADAVNAVDVGQTTASNFNEIHLFQTSAGGFNQIGMTIDGDSNIINVDQQTAMGYTYVNMTVTGNSNTVDIIQN